MKKTNSSRGRTLSGHTWSTAKKFSIMHLSSLHPYGKLYLGYTAWLRFTLLGNCSQLLSNSSRWSDHEFDCSASFAPARTSSRRRCTTGTRRSRTSYGGYHPGYPWQTTWVALLGVVQPTRRRPMVHGTARHAPQDIKGDILKMLRDLLGYVRSHDSCNLLLLSGYLLDLTDL